MKRALALIALLVSANADAAEKWLDNYNNGVAAVNGRRYDSGAALLQKAIAERPNEGTELKVGLTIVAAYTPHFWLGIAKFNQGDVDGALREWRVSEEQGAIARTAYYSKLKDWVARAQAEKQIQAEKAASGARKAADAAIRRAVESQGDALSAGGDRTDAYRDAQRKLQDALNNFRKAGTNTAAYDAVTATAEQAAQSFGAAAEEGKRLKAVANNRPKPPVPAPKPVEIDIPFDEPAPPKTDTAVTKPPVPVPVPVEPKPKPDTKPADTRPVIPTTTSVAGPTPVPVPDTKPVPAPPVKVDVTPAYRAFATGDLVSAERLLTRMLATTPAAEAYLLRGCVRYTQAMLSRSPDALLLAATDDFRAALERNRALRLDRRVFSPKLVERFEQIRSGR